MDSNIDNDGDQIEILRGESFSLFASPDIRLNTQPESKCVKNGRIRDIKRKAADPHNKVPKPAY